MRRDKPVIVALDYANVNSMWQLVNQLDPSLCRLKIGKEMFTHFGPELVRELVKKGYDVFLDLKFHDIPNTVAKAVAAAAELGVWMLNVHASGGKEMLKAAKQALAEMNKPPLLIAVTVLTSMEQDDLFDIGIGSSPLQQVQRLAKLTADCELDGVVCSAQEVNSLRKIMNDDFLLITPGIRPESSGKDDQRRVLTPKQALQKGSDYLVIGRPITKSTNPAATLQEILSSCN